MAVKIVMIGAGNIGSRHLQALALLDRDAEIQVVDTAVESLKLSEGRFNSVYEKRQNEEDSCPIIRVSYLQNIDEINKDADVAIVATSAGPRRSIVEYIANNTNIKYMILEKVLFQSVKDLYEVGSLLKANNIYAWVDCARRDYNYYWELKEKLKDEAYINMHAEGGDWGMGCNGIHILDLYALLTGENTFIADNSGLDHAVRQTKREGYAEFTGQERLTCKRGILTMTSNHDSNARFIITIASNNYFYVLDEGAKIAECRNSADGWKPHEEHPDFGYVSQITQLNVQDIMDKGDCKLTKYEESVGIHECLLNSFLDHYNRVLEEGIKICPVT